uniref:Uncharacterized protein n=1 Tax=Desertifilum tharense IPPAS B-1220 TaxID=1781255 RepID=A0ACD5GXJ9_9CYAN
MGVRSWGKKGNWELGVGGWGEEGGRLTYYYTSQHSALYTQHLEKHSALFSPILFLT